MDDEVDEESLNFLNAYTKKKEVKKVERVSETGALYHMPSKPKWRGKT